MEDPFTPATPMWNPITQTAHVESIYSDNLIKA